MLTQRQVLTLLKEGVYVVDPLTAKVSRGGREVTSVDCDGRAFVRLYFDGARKMIAVCRLNWMAQTLSTIPKGWEVHHRDLDRRNDAWANLVCLHRLDHKKEHTDEQPEIPF